jgi:hypothetical protein
MWGLLECCSLDGGKLVLKFRKYVVPLFVRSGDPTSRYSVISQNPLIFMWILLNMLWNGSHFWNIFFGVEVELLIAIDLYLKIHAYSARGLLSDTKAVGRKCRKSVMQSFQNVESGSLTVTLNATQNYPQQNCQRRVLETVRTWTVFFSSCSSRISRLIRAILTVLVLKITVFCGVAQWRLVTTDGFSEEHAGFVFRLNN